MENILYYYKYVGRFKSIDHNDILEMKIFRVKQFNWTKGLQKSNNRWSTTNITPLQYRYKGKV